MFLDRYSVTYYRNLLRTILHSLYILYNPPQWPQNFPSPPYVPYTCARASDQVFEYHSEGGGWRVSRGNSQSCMQGGKDYRCYCGRRIRQYNCIMQVDHSSKDRSRGRCQNCQNTKDNYHGSPGASNNAATLEFILPITVGGRVRKHYAILDLANCLIYLVA
jgi:hypothetical protein